MSEIKGLDELADSLELTPERKSDLEEIALDRMFRGYSPGETLARAIERKLQIKERAPKRGNLRGART